MYLAAVQAQDRVREGAVADQGYECTWQQCRHRVEYEKVQWLTKDMSVPGSSAGTG